MDAIAKTGAQRKEAAEVVARSPLVLQQKLETRNDDKRIKSEKKWTKK